MIAVCAHSTGSLNQVSFDAPMQAHCSQAHAAPGDSPPTPTFDQLVFRFCPGARGAAAAGAMADCVMHCFELGGRLVSIEPLLTEIRVSRRRGSSTACKAGSKGYTHRRGWDGDALMVYLPDWWTSNEQEQTSLYNNVRETESRAPSFSALPLFSPR